MGKKVKVIIYADTEENLNKALEVLDKENVEYQAFDVEDDE